MYFVSPLFLMSESISIKDHDVETTLVSASEEVHSWSTKKENQIMFLSICTETTTRELVTQKIKRQQYIHI